jgi:hypothetical protein
MSCHKSSSRLPAFSTTKLVTISFSNSAPANETAYTGSPARLGGVIPAKYIGGAANALTAAFTGPPDPCTVIITASENTIAGHFGRGHASRATVIFTNFPFNYAGRNVGLSATLSSSSNAASYTSWTNCTVETT